jgi:hypothetical protein
MKNFSSHFLLVLIFFFTQEGSAQQRRAILPGSQQRESSGSSSSKPSNWAIGIGYSLNSHLKFNSAYFPTNNGAATVYDVYYAPSAVLTLEYRVLPKNDYGFLASITADTDRLFLKGTSTTNGITQSLNNQTKWQTTIISLGFAYRWESFYIPFGFNYAFFHLTPDPSYTGSLKTTVQPDARLGLGWQFGERLAFETLIFDMVKVHMSEDVGGQHFDYGDGNLYFGSFVLKYIF